MPKYLLFATALTAALAQGQIPKLPDPKADVNLNGVRKPEVPKLEAPKPGMPKLEAPKLEAPKLEAPKLDAAKLNPVKVDPLLLPMPASFAIKEAQGGPLRTKLTGSNRVVAPPPATVLNERSTLSRKAYILNDEKCPVLIEELTVTPVEGKDWRMVLDGQIRARPAIAAADIRFALFDLFGNHLSTQQKLLIEDIGAGDVGLVLGPSWGTSEKEVKVLHTTFAFVAQVRLADGSVWKYDPMDVARALVKLHLRTDPSRLEPVKE